MVGATDVIVGNASVQLAGVAGGLQSTAMPIGGTIGTAVLGAIMQARIAELMTNVTHTTFISGMKGAFGVASVVALAGALIALLTRRGSSTRAPR
jgi:hypothetical protein